MSLLNLLIGLLRKKPRPTQPPPAPPPPAADPSPVDALNRARAAEGLPPLRADPGLQDTASRWAAQLAATGGPPTHGYASSRLWSVHPGVPIGEDVAMGHPTDAKAVAGWLSDPAHRVILLGHFDAAGMAHADGPDGRYWVADFARLG